MAAASLAGCIDEASLRQPTIEIVPGAPPGWIGTAGTPGVGLSVSDARTGANAGYLSGAFQSGVGVYRLYQNIKADDYRGRRVQLSAWMKPRNVGSVSFSGLFMRVDGPGQTLQFDDMSRRPVAGLGGWRLVSVVLDVDSSAIGLSLGAQFFASNTLLIDDMRLEVVPTSVNSTNTLFTPTSNGLDSLGVVEQYRRSPFAPVNLDFEGLPSLNGSTSSWLALNAVALQSVDPASTANDLSTLPTLVGAASIVGLGEATYGTREFVQLKHRLLRSLVTSMGFTTLAIDAPLAEVADLNVYLQGGAGDLASLQSNLYAWHLDAQEMRDVFTWIRAYNMGAPPAQRLQVVGIDAQFPGASMDSVAAFVHRVAPEYDVDVQVYYECLQPFRNHGATAGEPASGYAAINAAYRALCAEQVNDILNLVTTRGAGAADYQQAVAHARVVKQFESIITNSSAAAGARAREAALAENVLALRGQHPSSRIAVWAHNDRVTRQTGSMGAALDAALGSAYRPMGFAFGTGAFNARQQQGGTILDPTPFTVPGVVQGSVEEAAMATNLALLLLDTRLVDDGSADAAPLAGPISMRTIGLAFDANTERAYHQPRLFPNDFDLLLFVRSGTPTTLRPGTGS